MFDGASGPRSRVCHVCGKPCLLGGYPHHVAQCKQKFLKVQEALPLHERRKLPPDPVALATPKTGPGGDDRTLVGGGNSPAELAALNAAAKAQ
jgi:hypothetical protein